MMTLEEMNDIRSENPRITPPMSEAEYAQAWAEEVGRKKEVSCALTEIATTLCKHIALRGEMTTSDLEARTGHSKSFISKRLSSLRMAGMVTTSGGRPPVHSITAAGRNHLSATNEAASEMIPTGKE